MADDTTIQMLSAYEQIAQPTLFLTGLFQSPPENFYNSEDVEIDIERTGEDVSIVVQDLSAGARQNSQDIYTNKRFKAPIHDEEMALNSFDLLSRNPGQNPYESVDYQINASTRALRGVSKMDAKIRRAVELQASQILQTGKLSLTDKNGAVLYALDFKPKVTHFTTATTAWDQAAATPLDDLEELADVIRGDGKLSPDQLIFGAKAFSNFIKNDDVRNSFDKRRYDLGTIAPVSVRGNGGKYMGTVIIGTYSFDIWMYDGRYTAPTTGDSTPYVAPESVIVRSSMGRLDATFGNIPLFADPNSRILPYLPSRISSPNGGFDIFVNSWIAPNGKQLTVSASSRPLLIPTAIDTFGCLDTGV